MVKKMEELHSQLNVERAALEDQEAQQHANAARAQKFERQMRSVSEQLLQLLSDSGEMARHNRHTGSVRMPGPAPGVDPDDPGQLQVQIGQQRRLLQAELDELRSSSEAFSSQAREHAGEANKIRRQMREIEESIKRLKEEIKKAKNHDQHNGKHGRGGPRGGGPGAGGSSRPQHSSAQSDPHDGGWSGGDYDKYLSNSGGGGQQSSSNSSGYNQAAAKAPGHVNSKRASGAVVQRTPQTNRK